MEFSHLDGDCFQLFLDHFSQSYPSDLNIIQLDNGRFHLGSKLKIPDNILLIFQPPYSPELNPIERVWHYLKQYLRWEIYQYIQQLKDKVCSVIEGLSPKIIASLTRWDYIKEALATVA